MTQPAPVTAPTDGALARIPLQIGTSSTWSAGRSAAGLFPGIALLGVAVHLLREHDLRYGLTVFVGVPAIGVLLVIFAVGHVFAAVRTRASDLQLYRDHLAGNGGRMGGATVAWSDLTAPYAELEEATARRITIWSMAGVLLAIFLESIPDKVTSRVQVWRLYLHQNGQRRLVAETDRPIERDSMHAAVASVCAVVTGQRYVAEAPAIQARILSCARCGGPAVPDDVPAVTCGYCGASVPVPQDIRGQAAAARSAAHSGEATSAIIAKLRDQPGAPRTNVGLALLSALMFGAWPLGWGLVAARVLVDGFQWQDALCLLLPFAAVLAGFFLARGRLADRGALQLLTLGFGALAPRREGEPYRCRRCQGPLPDPGLGGVVHCRYCSAENIVGLDLRPTVDQARAEQVTFDAALAARSAEKRLWATLSAVAVAALAFWVVGTAAYIVHIEADGPPGVHHDGTKGHAAPQHPGGGKRGR